jgi:diguanylate cyclase (GGDEF)-like protein
MDPVSAPVPIADPIVVPSMDDLWTPLWIYDFDEARVVWANAAGLRLWRATSREALAARDLRADMTPSIEARLLQFRDDFLRGAGHQSETWTLYPGGRPTTLRVVFSGIRLADGRLAMLCEGRAELSETPERIRSAEALLHTPVMITLHDPSGLPVYRNPASRHSRATTDGHFADRFVDPGDHAALMNEIETHGQGVAVARVKTATGTRWHEISARICHDAVDGSPALLVTETDVTAHKTAEIRIRYLAEHDTLTGLPNRSGLHDELARRIAAAAGRQDSIAVLFVDLDRFKTINDSLGHSTGDGILVQSSERLIDAVGTRGFVARFGGDEFLVCLDLDGDAAVASETAGRILTALERPMRVGPRELAVSASIGIAVHPRDGADIDTLMRHADVAMYTAKEHGAGRWATFDASMMADVEQQLHYETRLRRALDRGEFEVWWQPRLSVATGRIAGAEALLRWHHPTLGLVMPGAFIPVAERSGLIDKIGACVLREAAIQQRVWSDAGHDLTVSVNLSARQFRDPVLPRMVEEVLREAGCAPGRLQLEITESLLIGDCRTSAANLDALAALGLSIAIDDFGTGYSNLATLQRHPIDTLKIDRSFVATLETQPALAELIIGMCRLLDMRIVAEGVETEEQLAWLEARNCHEYQGYLFSPAIPADDFDNLLRRQDELLAAPGSTDGRSPLWDLVPLVRRDGDLEWQTPGEPAKVRRLAIAGAVEAFVRREQH